MKTPLKTLRTTLGSLALGALMVAPMAQADTVLSGVDMDNREFGHFAPTNTAAADAGLEGLAAGILNSQVGHFAARTSSAQGGFLEHSVYGRTELINR